MFVADGNSRFGRWFAYAAILGDGLSASGLSYKYRQYALLLVATQQRGTVP
jgi:hypothetical protein